MKIFSNITLGKAAAGFVLLISISITLWIWHSSKANIENHTREHFIFQTQEIISAIRDRMRAQEQVLRGGIGLFLASDEVSRREWRIYVENLKLEDNYPGILGMGFSRLIRPEEKNNHIRQIREEGFSDYTLWPEEERAVYTAIVFLEPFNWRNQRAFGYDMFSEPVRRAAMEKARDTGNPAVSGKIILVQETNEDIQAGFLMYLPLYHGGMPRDTLQQRRAALKGYVYSPFRMDDLMEGILGRRTAEVHLEIYDGTVLSEQTLMYDNEPSMHFSLEKGSAVSSTPVFPAPGQLTRTIPLDLRDHTWTLHFASLPSSHTLDNRTPFILLMAGSFTSLLLFIVVWTLATNRERAVTLAHQMTIATQETEIRLQEITSTLGEGVYVQDHNGLITFVNPEAERLLKWSKEEMIGQDAHTLLHYHSGTTRFPHGICPMLRAMQAGTGYRSDDDVYWHKGGSTFSVAVIASPIIRHGEYRGAVVAFRDITEHKKTELALRESQRFRALFEYARDLFLLIEANGRIVDANRLVCESLGLGRQDLIGTHPESFTRHMTIANQPVSLTQALNRARVDESVLVDGEFVRRNGSSFPIEAMFSRIQYENRPLLLAAIRDVTERKQAEEKLKRTLLELNQAKRETEHINRRLAKVNKELRRLSNQDGLTGIANRRYFDDYLAKEWRRAIRTGQPLSLIMVDVDYFKEYNDLYGHQAGDDCLRQITHILHREVNRPADLLARYGGEEFVAVLPDTDPEGARHIAEKMRASIEFLEIPHARSSISPHVTISLGIATTIPTPENALKSLIEEADRALYKAKEKGRNRISSHAPENPRKLA